MSSSDKKKIIILFAVMAGWFILDRLLKGFFDSGAFQIGQMITGSILGIFHLTLVHNTGAAFGMFAQSTTILAVISIAISLLFIAVYFMQIALLNSKASKYRISVLQTVCVAAICAGGLGNAMDRIVNGYVVDYICLDFISFPVFNLADIGVTCGIIVLVGTMVYNLVKEKRAKKAQ